MLLDKGGGEDDEQSPDSCNPVDDPVTLQHPAAPGTEIDGQRVEDVDRRKNVRRSIFGIQVFHEGDKNVVPGERRRADVKSIGPYRGCYKEDRHADRSQRKHQVELAGILVYEHEEAVGKGHVDKPAEVEDDKEFHEGDPVIERTVDQVKRAGGCDVFFQEAECKHVDQTVDRQDP